MDAKMSKKKCEEKENYLHSFCRVSKYFLQTFINYKGKNSKFIVEKPSRLTLTEVNATSVTHPVLPGMIYGEKHITLVVFLPKMHKAQSVHEKLKTNPN